MCKERVSVVMRVALSTLFAWAVISAPPMQAQTLTVLHGFTGGADGAVPFAGVTMDRAGNLYGTATAGGNRSGKCYGSCGTVFRLTHSGSGWVFAPIYDFVGGDDGSDPIAGVTIGPDGAVYGATAMGGGGCTSDYGCGTVFKLTPPARPAMQRCVPGRRPCSTDSPTARWARLALRRRDF